MPADKAVASRGAAPEPARAGLALFSKPWWPAARRVLIIGFALLVLGLLIDYARTIEWSAVVKSMRALPLPTLFAAAGLAAASYAVYCTYDLIGRQQTGHALRAYQVAGVGFIAYAFNLNLGSLVGSIAVRFRLYSRVGLSADVITRIVVLSMLTNWLGYVFLAGSVFLLRPLALPPDWKLGSAGLQWLGAGLLALALGYVATCFLATRRVWHLRGHALKLPSGRVALLQLLLSSLNWALIAGVIHVLLRHGVDYASVLSVLLVAAVAGVVTHVPANLGVLEAVFLALLSHRVGQGELVAALLAYRAIYYLAPLAVAAVLFMIVSARITSADERTRTRPTTREPAPIHTRGSGA